jgi:hypothetical protein
MPEQVRDCYIGPDRPGLTPEEGNMTVVDLIAAGLAILFLVAFVGYALNLLTYALGNDHVIHERLKQVTR